MTSLSRETLLALAEAMALWAPPTELTVSQWAESEFVLAPEEAERPGRYSLENHEFLRAILDAFSDPEIREIVVEKAAQLGWTTAITIMIGYTVAHDPSRILTVMPTQDEGEVWSKDRFEPCIRLTPSVAGRLRSPKSRDGQNTLLHKKFAGGTLKIVGANSPTGLASWPAPRVVLDEVDRYPASAGDEGDPIALVRKRNQSFRARRKLIMGSTPDTEEGSVIHREVARAGVHLFHVPCHHCGGELIPDFWKHVKWGRDEGGKGDPSTACFECEHCHEPWSDIDRIRNIRNGRWVGPGAINGRLGFRLPGLLSPTVTHRELAERWLGCRSDLERQAFYNLDLGEVWKTVVERVDRARLWERRAPYEFGTVPLGGVVLTAGVDIQRNRLIVSVWAWGRGSRSWLVDHRELQGRPSEPEAWAELSAMLAGEYRHEAGQALRISHLAIDTGDGLTNQFANRWVAKQSVRRVVPVRGSSHEDKMRLSRATPVQRGSPIRLGQGGRGSRSEHHLHTVATGVLKGEFREFLRLEHESGREPPPGYVTLPISASAELIEQLTSEDPVRQRDGSYQWRRQGENHALDCRVYAAAAAWLMRLDRWTEARWRDEEAKLGLVEPAEPAALVPTPPAAPEPSRAPAIEARPSLRPFRQRNDFGSDWLGGWR